jgi:hypothetical protein
VPWGLVDYWWKENEKPGYGKSIHLLWQMGNKLFRARMSEGCYDPTRGGHCFELDFEDLEVIWWSKVLKGEIDISSYSSYSSARLDVFGVRFGVAVNGNDVGRLRSYLQCKGEGWTIANETKNWVQALKEMVNDRLNDSMSAVERECAAIEAYKTKTFPMLADLEQLYIAA